MKAFVVALMLMTLVAGAAVALGNSEKIDSVEGVVVALPGEGGQTRVMLRTDAGEEIVLDLPEAELLQLQLREQTRITVEGVFIGVPEGQQVQARILARVVVADGQSHTVANPVRLTEQDRTQIREWERTQSQTASGTQTQTQAQTKTQTQTQSQTQTKDGTSAGTGEAAENKSSGK